MEDTRLWGSVGVDLTVIQSAPARLHAVNFSFVPTFIILLYYYCIIWNTSYLYFLNSN